MTKCLFRRSDGVFVGGSRWDDIPHDKSTHVQIELPENPNPRTQRWDNSNGLRDATAQEVADYDEADVTKAVTRELDDTKLLKAMVRWLAPLVGKTPASARSEIIAIYKSL